MAGGRLLTVVFQGRDDDWPGSVRTYDDGTRPGAFFLSGLSAKTEFGGQTCLDSGESVVAAFCGSASGVCAVGLRTGVLLWSEDDAIPVGAGSGRVIAVAGSRTRAAGTRGWCRSACAMAGNASWALSTPRDRALVMSIRNVELSWPGSML